MWQCFGSAELSDKFENSWRGSQILKIAVRKTGFPGIAKLSQSMNLQIFAFLVDLNSHFKLWYSRFIRQWLKDNIMNPKRHETSCFATYRNKSRREMFPFTVLGYSHEFQGDLTLSVLHKKHCEESKCP